MCTVQNFLVAWGEREMMWPKGEERKRNFGNGIATIIAADFLTATFTNCLTSHDWKRGEKHLYCGNNITDIGEREKKLYCVNTTPWIGERKEEKKKIVLWQYQCQYRREERGKKIILWKNHCPNKREQREKKKLYYDSWLCY